MKKRFLLGAMLMTVAFAFAGCGTEVAQEPVVETQEVAEVTEAVEDDAEEVSDSKDDTEAVEEEIIEEEKVVEQVEYTQEELEAMSSVDFAAILKAGWNLGNTLDATDSKGLDSETSWGQPLTTPELIAFVKESGFTSIRIPVSWGNHTDSDYQIDEAWMARVKEVVDYAYDEGLFVIINSHHDCDYYYPDTDHYAESEKYLTTIWTQIAEEFKDYDDHLIFESMNEPRLKGTDIEWWFAASDPKGRESIGVICKLNQAFVDTIRNSGGNNENRFIMVPSYAASPDFALNSAFSMPEDPSDKVMLSVHAYTPYDFAGKGTGYKDWDGSKTTEFVFMGKLMSTFKMNGYGIVIGEFGATNKDNQPDREKWARGYTMKAASYGMSYFVWDNGAIGVGEENFGLIDRRNLKLYFPDLVDAYLVGYRPFNQ